MDRSSCVKAVKRKSLAGYRPKMLDDSRPTKCIEDAASSTMTCLIILRTGFSVDIAKFGFRAI